jgi:hypothetical protein
MTKNEAILKIRRELQKDEFNIFTVVHYERRRKTVHKAVRDEYNRIHSRNAGSESGETLPSKQPS